MSDHVSPHPAVLQRPSTLHRHNSTQVTNMCIIYYTHTAIKKKVINDYILLWCLIMFSYLRLCLSQLASYAGQLKGLSPIHMYMMNDKVS